MIEQTIGNIIGLTYISSFKDNWIEDVNEIIHLFAEREGFFLSIKMFVNQAINKTFLNLMT